MYVRAAEGSALRSLLFFFIFDKDVGRGCVQRDAVCVIVLYLWIGNVTGGCESGKKG